MTLVSVCVACNGALKDEWELATVWKEVVVFSSRYYSALPKKKQRKLGWLMTGRFSKYAFLDKSVEPCRYVNVLGMISARVLSRLC
jgi:hypothetical protein